jgi:copper chaperone
MKKLNYVFALALFLGPAFSGATNLTKTDQAPQVFHVAGMHCGGCAKMIESKVCKLEGVKTCSVEVGKIVLTGESLVEAEKIQTALSEAGEYKLVATAAEATPHLPGKKSKKKHSKKENE